MISAEINTTADVGFRFDGSDFDDSCAFTELANGIEAALRPRERMPLVDWVPSVIRLPAEMTADGGRQRVDGAFSFLRGILEAADDPETREISIMKSAQIGGTIAMLAIMLGLAVIAPSPAMLVAPDTKALRELRQRIYAIADGSGEELSGRTLPEHLRNDDWINLQESIIHLAISTNKQSLSSKTCARVLMTEVDRYDVRRSNEGDTMALARERVKMFAAVSLILMESTPTLKGTSRIAHQYYDLSDRRLFNVPCFRCGHFQPLRVYPYKHGPFAGRGGLHGLKDSKGNWFSIDQVRQSAFVPCRNCQKPIEEKYRSAMAEAGIWVPHGCHVDDAGKLVGTPERSPRHKGFHLNTLNAPSDRIKFGDVAAELAAAIGKPKKMQVFTNNWAGLTYEPERKRTSWEDLRDWLTTSVPFGTLHPESIFLTAGVDVQGAENGCRYVVRAWWVRDNQCTSCKVESGSLMPIVDEHGRLVTSSDLDQLDALVLDRSWDLPQADGTTRQLTVQKMLIDTGGTGTRTNEIYAWVRKRPGDRVRAIKGYNGQPGHWKKADTERSPVDGSTIEGLVLWLIHVDLFKEDIRARWASAQSSPGAWLACSGSPAQYWQEVVNESPQVDERGRLAWSPVDSNIPHDFWDCEVYARAGAEMIVGVDGWYQLPAMNAELVAAERNALADALEAHRLVRESIPPPVIPIDRPGGWAAR